MKAKTKQKESGIYYTQNGITHKLRNETRAHGAGLLWNCLDLAKTEMHKKVIKDIHGLLCATLHGTVEHVE